MANITLKATMGADGKKVGHILDSEGNTIAEYDPKKFDQGGTWYLRSVLAQEAGVSKGEAWKDINKSNPGMNHRTMNDDAAGGVTMKISDDLMEKLNPKPAQLPKTPPPVSARQAQTITPRATENDPNGTYTGADIRANQDVARRVNGGVDPTTGRQTSGELETAEQARTQAEERVTRTTPEEAYRTISQGVTSEFPITDNTPPEIVAIKKKAVVLEKATERLDTYKTNGMARAQIAAEEGYTTIGAVAGVNPVVKSALDAKVANAEAGFNQAIADIPADRLDTVTDHVKAVVNGATPTPRSIQTAPTAPAETIVASQGRTPMNAKISASTLNNTRRFQADAATDGAPVTTAESCNWLCRTMNSAASWLGVSEAQAAPAAPKLSSAAIKQSFSSTF